MFSRFDKIPRCYGQMDLCTNGDSKFLYKHQPCVKLPMRSRDKKDQNSQLLVTNRAMLR